MQQTFFGVSRMVFSLSLNVLQNSQTDDVPADDVK